MGQGIKKGALFTLLWLILASLAYGQGAPVGTTNVRVVKRVRTLQEIRGDKVVRQRWDLSCGSAALSTILTHYLNDDTPESSVVAWLLRRTDPVRVQSRGGFSLLDLKRFAQAKGYSAEGFSGMTLEELLQRNSPAILPIRRKGYDHFVVFRGAAGNRIFLSDPAFGNLTVTTGDFQRTWKSGIAFFVHRPAARVTLYAGQEEQPGFAVAEGPMVFRALRGPVSAPALRTP